MTSYNSSNVLTSCHDVTHEADDISEQCDLVRTAELQRIRPQKVQAEQQQIYCHGRAEHTVPQHHAAQSDPGGGRSCCGVRMSRHQCVVFWLCGVVNFGASASVATMAPFFPQEANRRGMSATTASLIFSVYSVAALVTSPFMTRLVPYVGPKHVFLAGCFLVGTGNIAFGSLVYISDLRMFTIYCFIVRLMMGTGAAANITATYTYVSGVFSDNIAVTVGLLEVFTALGTCAGPALGGLLYMVGGYSIPFYSVGGFLILALPVTVVAMPAVKVRPHAPASCRHLLAYFPVYIVLGAVAMVTMIFGFSEASLAQYLYTQFQLPPRTIGLVFLMFAIAYGLASPMFGCLSDVIRHRSLLIGCSLVLAACAMAFFSPPPPVAVIPSDQLWWALLVLCLTAVLAAGAMIPTFGVVVHMLKGPVGLPDDVTTDALASSTFQTFFYLGVF